MARRQPRDIRSEFGDHVRSKRLALGLSQEDFAEKAGLDRTYIGGIERGRRNVSLLNIEKIADALDIPVRDLFPNG
jgi:transcriptional regulator with XRE-family HTH domain